MTGLPPRPCLIDGEMHSGERFFSPGEANICRNLQEYFVYFKNF